MLNKKFADVGTSGGAIVGGKNAKIGDCTSAVESVSQHSIVIAAAVSFFFVPTKLF